MSYLIKADLFYQVKNYEAALENYEKSYFYNEKIQSDYINKIRQVTNSIIDQANDATNKGDILFALSSLNQLITLRPELEEDLDFGLEALKVKLEDLSDSKTQAHIQDYIESDFIVDVGLGVFTFIVSLFVIINITTLICLMY